MLPRMQTKTLELQHMRQEAGKSMNFKHFIALNIADALTTWYLLTYIHGVGELNPIYSYAYTQIGLIPGLVLLKLI